MSETETHGGTSGTWSSRQYNLWRSNCNAFQNKLPHDLGDILSNLIVDMSNESHKASNALSILGFILADASELIAHSSDESVVPNLKHIIEILVNHHLRVENGTTNLKLSLLALQHSECQDFLQDYVENIITSVIQIHFQFRGCQENLDSLMIAKMCIEVLFTMLRQFPEMCARHGKSLGDILLYTCQRVDSDKDRKVFESSQILEKGHNVEEYIAQYGSRATGFLAIDLLEYMGSTADEIYCAFLPSALKFLTETINALHRLLKHVGAAKKSSRKPKKDGKDIDADADCTLDSPKEKRKIISYCGRVWRLTVRILCYRCPGACYDYRAHWNDQHYDNANQEALTGTSGGVGKFAGSEKIQSQTGYLLSLLVPANRVGILSSNLQDFFKIELVDGGWLEAAICLECLALQVSQFDELRENKALLKLFRNNVKFIFARLKGVEAREEAKVMGVAGRLLCYLIWNFGGVAADVLESTVTVAKSICKYDCDSDESGGKVDSNVSLQMMSEELMLKAKLLALTNSSWKAYVAINTHFDTDHTYRDFCVKDSGEADLTAAQHSIRCSGLFAQGSASPEELDCKCMPDVNNILAEMKKASTILHHIHIHIIERMNSDITSHVECGGVDGSSDQACDTLKERLRNAIILLIYMWQLGVNAIGRKFMYELERQKISTQCSQALSQVHQSNFGSYLCSQNQNHFDDDEDGLVGSDYVRTDTAHSSTPVLLTFDGSQAHGVAGEAISMANAIGSMFQELFQIGTDIWVFTFRNPIGTCLHHQRALFVESYWWLLHRLSGFGIAIPSEDMSRVLRENDSLHVSSFAQATAGKLGCEDVSDLGRIGESMVGYAVDVTMEHGYMLQREADITSKLIVSLMPLRWALSRCLRGIIGSNTLCDVLEWVPHQLLETTRVAQHFLQFISSRQQDIVKAGSGGGNAASARYRRGCVLQRSRMVDCRPATLILTPIIEKAISLCVKLACPQEEKEGSPGKKHVNVGIDNGMKSPFSPLRGSRRPLASPSRAVKLQHHYQQDQQHQHQHHHQRAEEHVAFEKNTTPVKDGVSPDHMPGSEGSRGSKAPIAMDSLIQPSMQSLTPETREDMIVALHSLINAPLIIIATGQPGLDSMTYSVGRPTSLSVAETYSSRKRSAVHDRFDDGIDNATSHARVKTPGKSPGKSGTRDTQSRQRVFFKNWEKLVDLWLGMLQISYPIFRDDSNKRLRSDQLPILMPRGLGHSEDLHNVGVGRLVMGSGGLAPSSIMRTGMSVHDFSATLMILSRVAHSLEKKIRQITCSNQPTDEPFAEYLTSVGHDISLLFLNAVSGWCDALKQVLSGSASLWELYESDSSVRSALGGTGLTKAANGDGKSLEKFKYWVYTGMLTVLEQLNGIDRLSDQDSGKGLGYLLIHMPRFSVQGGPKAKKRSMAPEVCIYGVDDVVSDADDANGGACSYSMRHEGLIVPVLFDLIFDVILTALRMKGPMKREGQGPCGDRDDEHSEDCEKMACEISCIVECAREWLKLVPSTLSTLLAAMTVRNGTDNGRYNVMRNQLRDRIKGFLLKLCIVRDENTEAELEGYWDMIHNLSKDLWGEWGCGEWPPTLSGEKKRSFTAHQRSQEAEVVVNSYGGSPKKFLKVDAGKISASLALGSHMKARQGVVPLTYTKADRQNIDRQTQESHAQAQSQSQSQSQSQLMSELQSHLELEIGDLRDFQGRECGHDGGGKQGEESVLLGGESGECREEKMVEEVPTASQHAADGMNQGTCSSRGVQGEASYACEGSEDHFDALRNQSATVENKSALEISNNPNVGDHDYSASNIICENAGARSLGSLNLTAEPSGIRERDGAGAVVEHVQSALVDVQRTVRNLLTEYVLKGATAVQAGTYMDVPVPGASAVPNRQDDATALEAVSEVNACGVPSPNPGPNPNPETDFHLNDSGRNGVGGNGRGSNCALEATGNIGHGIDHDVRAKWSRGLMDVFQSIHSLTGSVLQLQPCLNPEPYLNPGCREDEINDADEQKR